MIMRWSYDDHVMFTYVYAADKTFAVRSALHHSPADG